MSYRALVSVIIACHNGEKYINDCLSSIVNQSFSDLEIIICDDCSTDNSFCMLKDWEKKDSRIKLFRNDSIQFAAASRNKCFEQARGLYFIIQDIDDYSEPDRVERLLDVLKKEKLDFVSSSMMAFKEDVKKVTGIVRMNSVYPSKYSFLWGISFNHPATMFTSSCIKDVEGYRVSTETRRGEDYDLFMKLYANGYRGKNINDALYRYRLDEDNFKRRTLKSRIDEIKIRKRGYKNLGIYYIGWLFAYKPLLAYLFQFFKKGVL